MRDSFDHYFDGWTPDPDNPAFSKFSSLVTAVGAYIASDPATAEDWRTFQLDGKKECFVHFVKRALEAGALPEDAQTMAQVLRSAFPRLMG